MKTQCPNPYYVPRLYTARRSSGAGEKLAVLDGEALAVENECPGEARLCLGKEPIYGVVLDTLVDLVAKRALQAFAVALPPEYDRAVVVEEGATLEPIPVTGVMASIEVCEGQKIREGGTIAYIVTRKGEIRHIRSHVEGLIAYIYYNPAPQTPVEAIVLIATGGARLVRVQPRRG